MLTFSGIEALELKEGTNISNCISYADNNVCTRIFHILIQHVVLSSILSLSLSLWDDPSPSHEAHMAQKEYLLDISSSSFSLQL